MNTETSPFQSAVLNGSTPSATPPQRGALTHADGRVCIGRVGAPARFEATSEEFYFWVPPDALVEKTQLLTCRSQIGAHEVTFYAIVDEVMRTSRGRSMGGEMDGYDGDLSYEPPFESEGCTYALASVLRAHPPILTPPRERSEVFLAGSGEAAFAYRVDDIDGDDKRLDVGLIKNGGQGLAGPGAIDLDYLLGTNGGHLNVNGAAGRGTKSSFLLWINWLLLKKAREQKMAAPSSSKRLRVVPIILNVKNFDLFHIDRASTRFEEKHRELWSEMGIENPTPFENVTYYAPQQAGSSLAIQSTGRGASVAPYSWSLKDVIERGLLEFLFAETDAHDANFSALVLDIQNHLTNEFVNNDGSTRLELKSDAPKNFTEFLEWAKEDGGGKLGNAHHTGTWRKLHRRLIKIVYESRGVLRREEKDGHPLSVVRDDTSDPQVIDLSSLSAIPELQRFVVATILRQLVDARTGENKIANLKYLVTLDELNRFAPHGAKDPVTRLIEQVAAEMRSQGVILLGAQQQASKVSDRVIENSAIRVVGKSGPLELSNSVWRILSDAAKRKAESLALDEKLIIQDNFREPMHVRVPFPAWALNSEEAGALPPTTALNGSTPSAQPPDDYADLFEN